MARRTRAARQMGATLYGLARTQGVLPRIREELAALAAALADPEVGGFFSSPLVSTALKLKTASETVGGALHPLVAATLDVAIERRRSAEMPEIRGEVERLAERDAGVVEAEVLTAYPLDAAELQRLSERLRGQLGRRLTLQPRLRRSLGAGVVVRMADREIDRSIEGRLAALKRGLKELR